MNEQDFAILQAMEKYGGSFVQQLAKLAHRADPNNFKLIKQTWPKYWEQYKKMSER